MIGIHNAAYQDSNQWISLTALQTGISTTSSYSRKNCKVDAYDNLINKNDGHDFWFEWDRRNTVYSSRKAEGLHRWHEKSKAEEGGWERRMFQLSHGTQICKKHNRTFYLIEFQFTNSTVSFFTYIHFCLSCPNDLVKLKIDRKFSKIMNICI